MAKKFQIWLKFWTLGKRSSMNSKQDNSLSLSLFPSFSLFLSLLPHSMSYSDSCWPQSRSQVEKKAWTFNGKKWCAVVLRPTLGCLTCASLPPARNSYKQVPWVFSSSSGPECRYEINPSSGISGTRELSGQCCGKSGKGY